MRWKKWFKLLAFLSLSTLLFFWLRSDFWTVKKINCRLDNQDCPADLWHKLAAFSLQKNLLFFPSEKLKEEIKQGFPQTGDLKIKKRIFNTLSFELQSKKPVAALSVESSGSLFYWLDEEGIVLSKTDKNNGLPLILIKNDPVLEVGQSFQYGGSQAIMSLVIGLKMHLVESKTLRLVSPREIEVWLEDETLILFNSEKDMENQLDSLQLILSRAKIEGKTIKKIDLRFDKPVIF